MNQDIVREVLDDLICRLPIGYALERLDHEIWIVLNDKEEMIAGGPTPTIALDEALIGLRK